MATVLFKTMDRDEGHQRLEQEIAAQVAAGRTPTACCTEVQDEIIVWDEQPMREQVIKQYPNRPWSF